MILTKKQSEERLASDNNICNPDRIVKEVTIIRKDGINNHVGNNGAKRLTEEERVAIATLSEVTNDNNTTAELFGVSKSHVSDLRNGNRVTREGDQLVRRTDVNLIKEKENRIEGHKLTIQERAAEKLLDAFGIFDQPEFQDQMKNAKPKEVASVMKDMSQVMRNLQGQKKEDGNQKSNVKIILHAPKTANESSFDVIEIGVSN